MSGGMDIEKLQQKKGNFPGNILFMSVPDEEANSMGMTDAVKFLNRLQKEERGLWYPLNHGNSRKYNSGQNLMLHT